MIFETRTRQFAVDLDLAGAQLEGSIDEIQRVASKNSGQKRPVIAGAIADDLSCDHDLRIRFVRQL